MPPLGPPLGGAPDVKAPELTEIARLSHLKGLNVNFSVGFKKRVGQDDTRMSVCVRARGCGQVIQSEQLQQLCQTTGGTGGDGTKLSRAGGTTSKTLRLGAQFSRHDMGDRVALLLLAVAASALAVEVRKTRVFRSFCRR